MEHQQYKEWLQLFVYDELDGEEQVKLHQHVQTCPECQAELSSLKKFHSVLKEFTPPVATEQALTEARQHLTGTLRTTPQRRSISEWIGGMLDPVFIPPVKVVLGGITILVLGVVIGSFVGKSVGEQPSGEPGVVAQQKSEVAPGDTRITNVRFINSNPSNGEIEFAFEAVKPVRMRGNINDEQIQRVLTHAILNDQNAGVRLASISAITSKSATPDKEIKNALITAVKSDDNPGVRTEAMNALKNFPVDSEIKDAVLFVLRHDNNPGLRITAINYLDSVKIHGQQLDQEYLNLLKEKMQSDNNNYIRLRAKTVVEENHQ